MSQIDRALSRTATHMYMARRLNPSFTSNKPRLYLLDYGDFHTATYFLYYLHSNRGQIQLREML